MKIIYIALFLVIVASSVLYFNKVNEPVSATNVIQVSGTMSRGQEIYKKDLKFKFSKDFAIELLFETMIGAKVHQRNLLFPSHADEKEYEVSFPITFKNDREKNTIILEIGYQPYELENGDDLEFKDVQNTNQINELKAGGSIEIFRIISKANQSLRYRILAKAKE